MSPLGLLIADEIRAGGPMRFDRYMELALYHGELGYYARVPKVGRAGDFFTSVSVGPLFGGLLARQAEQMWRLLERPDPFWIVEQGAHDGQLAVDVMEACRRDFADFFAAIRYLIIEPLPALAGRQQRVLHESGLVEKATWSSSLVERSEPPRRGLFLSNELIDAFPVRVIRRERDEWRERRVALSGTGDFVWVSAPVSDAPLSDAIAALPLPELEGYTTEINLAVRDWMAKVANLLDTGYGLTLDYGYAASDYYAAHRTAGTLTARRRHRRVDSVLSQPGELDMTVHVDFSALARAGEAAGLSTLGWVDQQHFLTGLAHAELSGRATFADGVTASPAAWQTLTHPNHLGARFHVLVQAKNAPGGLDGLRYARGGLD